MRRIKHTCALTAGVTALCIHIAAIAQDQKPSAPAIIPANSKLDIDPTETISIIGWWTNGEEIMLIKQDGAFNWWGQPNRFRPPSKIGRWDRQNYRTFWLEPYVDRKNPGVMPPRIRAPMRRTDGKILLMLDWHSTCFMLMWLLLHPKISMLEFGADLAEVYLLEQMEDMTWKQRRFLQMVLSFFPERATKELGASMVNTSDCFLMALLRIL